MSNISDKKISIKCRRFAVLPKKERISAIISELERLYPDAECALDFRGDPFRLLIMARLSAQCTDKRVNIVSEKLFKIFPDAESFKNAELSEIEEIIKPCGLFHSKAKSIKEMSQIIVDIYGGKVPRDKKELLSLPGVGEKIANLMLGDVFGDPHIVADTHCIRLSQRFGLCASSDPKKVTASLEKLIPKNEQAVFCHRLITLGREYCKAPNPKCEECPMKCEKSL